MKTLNAFEIRAVAGGIIVLPNGACWYVPPTGMGFADYLQIDGAYGEYLNSKLSRDALSQVLSGVAQSQLDIYKMNMQAWGKYYPSNVMQLKEAL
jgi:uncharacterized membrane protein